MTVTQVAWAECEVCGVKDHAILRNAQWVIPLTWTHILITISGYQPVEFDVCNSQNCLPALFVEFGERRAKGGDSGRYEIAQLVEKIKARRMAAVAGVMAAQAATIQGAIQEALDA